MTALTIVMYHYVRQLEATPYPRIRARRTSEFRHQLAHFRRHFHPVTIAEVVHAIRTGDALPPNALLLTFDDGYREHFETCLPLLVEAGMQGAFFPPVEPIVHGTLLDVNRVHFVLASANVEEIGRKVDAAVERRRITDGLRSPADYRAEWAVPSRLDDAETIYVKRMLQVALPAPVRNAIAADLFAEYVSRDEAAFAAELYCTEGELSQMVQAGMYVGSHGATHAWLNAVDAPTLRREIQDSLTFLRRIGSPVDDYWVMCYPYGGWNAQTLEVLRDHQCSMGLTTAVAQANLATDDPLLLPRFDTNDFPITPA